MSSNKDLPSLDWLTTLKPLVPKLPNTPKDFQKVPVKMSTGNESTTTHMSTEGISSDSSSTSSSPLEASRPTPAKDIRADLFGSKEAKSNKKKKTSKPSTKFVLQQHPTLQNAPLASAPLNFTLFSAPHSAARMHLHAIRLSETRVSKILNVTEQYLQWNPANEETKPPFTFACLIAISLADTSNQMLRVTGIYDWIQSHFPYYEIRHDNGWKNSVRHTLSLNKAFCRVGSGNGASLQKKGCHWTLAPGYGEAISSFVRKYAHVFKFMPQPAPEPIQNKVILERLLAFAPEHEGAPKDLLSCATYFNSNTTEYEPSEVGSYRVAGRNQDLESQPNQHHLQDTSTGELGAELFAALADFNNSIPMQSTQLGNRRESSRYRSSFTGSLSTIPDSEGMSMHDDPSQLSFSWSPGMLSCINREIRSSSCIPFSSPRQARESHEVVAMQLGSLNAAPVSSRSSFDALSPRRASSLTTFGQSLELASPHRSLNRIELPYNILPQELIDIIGSEFPSPRRMSQVPLPSPSRVPVNPSHEWRPSRNSDTESEDSQHSPCYFHPGDQIVVLPPSTSSSSSFLPSPQVMQGTSSFADPTMFPVAPVPRRERVPSLSSLDGLDITTINLHPTRNLPSHHLQFNPPSSSTAPSYQSQ